MVFVEIVSKRIFYGLSDGPIVPFEQNMFI